MKFPYSMLLDYVKTPLTAEEAGDLLTMAGFELEGIEPFGDDDAILDLKVVSNRGDGLSMAGVARELYAKEPDSAPTELFVRASQRFADSPEGSLVLDPGAVEILALECLRFSARSFENVPVDRPSPAWIQTRLEAAGIRDISLLVDLTNYVMLEIGQPLHAYDRDKLHGDRIVVRYAAPGEKLTTLNGEEHELAGQMMICDGDRPIGVPGVMGGLDTEIHPETTRVLLEAANFLNTNVRKTRKQLGLATEASHRFERSVDPELPPAAIRRFTELLLQIVPEARYSNLVDWYPHPVRREKITLRPERASRLLGMKVPYPSAVEHLQRLGMGLEEDGLTFTVTPPTWRPDIVREEDLIEELGRIHGYERIPERLPEGNTVMGGPQGRELWVDLFRESAVRAGFIQVISHSLRDQHPLDDPNLPAIGPRNPSSPEMAYLRNSVLPCLSDAARRNGSKNLALFEMGRVFGQSETCVERNKVGFLNTGGGFFEFKGLLAAILSGSGIGARSEAPPAPDPRLHPSRQARLLLGNEIVGLMGQLHPDLADALDLPVETVVAEFDLDQAFAHRATTLDLHAVSRYPAVRRDISILVDKGVPYEKIERVIAESAGEVLEKQWLFDIYTGKGIPEASHSLAIALQLRKSDGTFTDEEANQVRERVAGGLVELGATLR